MASSLLLVFRFSFLFIFVKNNLPAPSGIPVPGKRPDQGNLQESYQRHKTCLRHGVHRLKKPFGQMVRKAAGRRRLNIESLRPQVYVS